MKFGKQFRASILKEWRIYAVEYKSLKKCLKKKQQEDTDDVVQNDEGRTFVTDDITTATPITASIASDNNESMRCVADDDDMTTIAFHAILEESIRKLSRFYSEEEQMVSSSLQRIEKQISDLHLVSNNMVTDQHVNAGPETILTDGDFSEGCCVDDQDKDSEEHYYCERYLCIRKDVFALRRELELLLEFWYWNQLAFSKILKKYDKRHTTGSILQPTMSRIRQQLDPSERGLRMIQDRANTIQLQLQNHEPQRFKDLKNCTILASGCFDLLHRGHANHLLFLREIGKRVVVMIPNDTTIVSRKHRPPIDNFEIRKSNLRPYADEIHELYDFTWKSHVESLTGNSDAHAWCYLGSDEYKARLSVTFRPLMTAYFLPRTENCSSTWIRKIYHEKEQAK